MFTAALFTTARGWEPPKWINGSIKCSIDIHWSLQRKETLMPATAWMNLHYATGEGSPSQKVKPDTVSLT